MSAPLASAVRDACVQHARLLLADQQPWVDAAGFDFMPPFRETMGDLYLIGVMWRFLDAHAPLSVARDQAFACLQHMLASDGMEFPDVRPRIDALRAVSLTADGGDHPAVLAGRKAEAGDHSMLNLFEPYRNRLDVADAPYRFFVRVKKLSFVGTLAGALLAGATAWLVSGDPPVVVGTALLAGVAAGVASLGIGLSMHRRMIAAPR